MQPSLRDPASFCSDCVSYHAVTRYVQRILGVTLDRDFQNSRLQAEAHCSAAGLSVSQVRDIIWTPGVQLAVLNGFRNVGTAEFRAAINECGIVVTIMKPRFRDRSKLKILSIRELSAQAHRFQRRVRQKSRTHKPKEED